MIPPGSQVYWKGGNSAVPLLYVPGIEVYAPQLNGDYTIYEHDDSDTLLKFGLWSDALARQWLQEADFVLIEARFYSGWLRDTVESGNLESLPPTPPTVTCRPSAQILVFQRSER
ncbi:MAG: hypothetical protein ACE5GO_03560 [Anaerolineales bacterium]